MTENYFGKKNGDVAGLLENLHTNLAASIKEYEENGYPYDFYITSVSGVFSDNAPINPAIADTVALFNEKYGEEVTMHMVTLQELYDKIRDKVQECTTMYRGALNDWWGNGRWKYTICGKTLQRSRTTEPYLRPTGRKNRGT